MRPEGKGQLLEDPQEKFSSGGHGSEVRIKYCERAKKKKWEFRESKQQPLEMLNH